MGSCVGKPAASPEHLIGRWSGGDDVKLAFREAALENDYQLGYDASPRWGNKYGAIVDIAPNGYMRLLVQNGKKAAVYCGPITSWAQGNPEDTIVGCFPKCGLSGGVKFKIGDFQTAEGAPWLPGDAPLALASFAINDIRVHREPRKNEDGASSPRSTLSTKASQLSVSQPHLSGP